MKYFLSRGVIVLLVFSGITFFLWQDQTRSPQHVVPIADEQSEAPQAAALVVPETLPVIPTVPEPLPEAILISDVPFTVQAPYALWADPLFQDACEEASIIMTEAWIKKTTLAPEGVKAEIEALARLQKKYFGHAIDTSIEDTAWLLGEYYGITAIRVVRDIEIGDIRQALADGNIVIVPTDGRKLKNLNFKQPGPPRHMVVIIGYDTKSGEFTTNDPGTRKGKDYRYPEGVLYEAITDYATGNHVPVTSTNKVMLAVGRD